MPKEKTKNADDFNVDETYEEDEWYDPATTKILPEGIYKGHITAVSISRNVATKSGKIATIYNPTFKIHKDSVELFKGDIEAKEIVKSKIGKEIRYRGFGVYRFHKKEGYDFVPSSNAFYYGFCQALQIPMTAENGKVKLPTLTEAAIIGRPVCARIVHETFTGDNGEVTIAKVAEFLPWIDGERIEINDDDDIPF